MDIYSIRLSNARTLASQELEKTGSRSNIHAMSNKTGKSLSQITQIIGKNPVKNIGSNLAREIESAFKKRNGWLDQQSIPADTIKIQNLLNSLFDPPNKISKKASNEEKLACFWHQLPVDVQSLHIEMMKVYLLKIKNKQE